MHFTHKIKWLFLIGINDYLKSFVNWTIKVSIDNRQTIQNSNFHHDTLNYIITLSKIMHNSKNVTSKSQLRSSNPMTDIHKHVGPIQDFLIYSYIGVVSFWALALLRRWGQCPVQSSPVQSRPNRKSRPFVQKCIFHCFLMQNVCNTNSRILIQQSEKFIFLRILVLLLGLHPAPDYACGVWTYKAYNARRSSLHKS